MTALHSCGVWLRTKLAEAAATARESPRCPPRRGGSRLPSPINLMHEGVAARRKVLASLLTLHPSPGCSCSRGKLSIPPPLRKASPTARESSPSAPPRSARVREQAVGGWVGRVR